MTAGSGVIAKTVLRGAAQELPIAVVLFDGQGVALTGTGGGPATVADGADVTQGANADAVVAAGAAGTISAKLRRMTTDLGALILQLPSSLGIKTAAASLSIAPASDAVFGIVQSTGIVTALTTFTRPADTTAYAIGDAFSDSTSAPTTGGFTLTGAARASGKSVILTDLLVTNSNPAATPLTGELHIFDVAVTAVNDNAAFAISDAEALSRVAIIPFTMLAGTNNNQVHVQNLSIGITTSGGANLRFLVKVTNAYTPTASETLSFRAKFLPVD